MTIADDAAATKWVEGFQSGATVLSVEPVTHGDASGFSVAYSYTTVDGDPRSGVAMLLNGPSSTLYAANLRFAGSNVDLNALRKQAQASAATPEATAEATQAAVSADAALAEVVDTFWILPALDMAPDPSSTTPTPLPIQQQATPSFVIPTFEVTSDATGEATAVATDAATAEATVAAPAATSAPAPTSTPAATVEATTAVTAEATP